MTEPTRGLPAKLKWLPSIAEVIEACEAKMPAPIRFPHRHALLEAPDMDRSARPTLDQLREKYGPNWGLKGMQ